MFCPKCGLELKDGVEFCIECGAKLRDFMPQQDVCAAEILCEMCGKGRLVLVESEGDKTLYRCNVCDIYFGNFMRRGITLYYNTDHLKIAQFINNKIVMSGEYSMEMSARNKGMELDCISGELAKELELDVNEAKDGVDYLLDNNILVKYTDKRNGKDFFCLKLNKIEIESLGADELLSV